MKRSERAPVVMPSELINVEHPFYNSPSVQAAMLHDKARTDAFEKAIKKISKNKKVLEIGTGTGILSLFAAKYGAKSVVATESADETFKVAKKTIKRNNYQDNISLIQYKNKPLKLPKDFDVIMSECLGHFAFDENMVSVVSLYKKHLSKNGTFLPRKISLYAALVENPDFYENSINSWRKMAYTFDFSEMRDLALNRIYIQTFKPNQIVSTVAKIINYDFLDKTPYLLKGSQNITIKRNSTVYGLAGWFSAELTKGVEINTSPLAKPTHWEQCFMPFKNPLTLKKGDVVEIKLTVASSKINNEVRFAWELHKSGAKLEMGEAIV